MLKTMKPQRNSTTNTIGKYPGCEDLPCCIDYENNRVVMYWEPSAEDLLLLAQGIPIKISFVGTVIPVMAVEVEAL
jgi:hypothetical protein